MRITFNVSPNPTNDFHIDTSVIRYNILAQAMRAGNNNRNSLNGSPLSILPLFYFISFSSCQISSQRESLALIFVMRLRFINTTSKNNIHTPLFFLTTKIRQSFPFV